MGGDIARTIRIGVVAPYTSDRVSLFEIMKSCHPARLRRIAMPMSAKAGTNDRDRAAGQTGGFPGWLQCQLVGQTLRLLG